MLKQLHRIFINSRSKSGLLDYVFLLFLTFFLCTLFKDNVKTTGETQVDEAVLEGHLGIAKELLSFMSPEKKYELGSDESKGILLIRVT